MNMEKLVKWEFYTWIFFLLLGVSITLSLMEMFEVAYYVLSVSVIFLVFGFKNYNDMFREKPRRRREKEVDAEVNVDKVLVIWMILGVAINLALNVLFNIGMTFALGYVVSLFALVVSTALGKEG